MNKYHTQRPNSLSLSLPRTPPINSAVDRPHHPAGRGGGAPGVTSTTPTPPGQPYNRRRSSLLLYGNSGLQILTRICTTYTLLLIVTLYYVVCYSSIPLIYSQHHPDWANFYQILIHFIIANLLINWALFVLCHSRYTGGPMLLSTPSSPSHYHLPLTTSSPSHYPVGSAASPSHYPVRGTASLPHYPVGGTASLPHYLVGGTAPPPHYPVGGTPPHYPVGITSPTTSPSSVCISCNHVIPMRAHHCIACRACILGRDHHCFFLGACVGLHNTRYFLAVLLHAALGTVLTTWMLYHHLLATPSPAPHIPWYSLMIFIALLRACAGFMTWTQVTLVLLLNLSFMALLGTSAIFLIYMYLGMRGQTMYEYTHGVMAHTDTTSWSHNLRAIFGPLWFVNFILPMPYKNTSNGLHCGDKWK